MREKTYYQRNGKVILNRAKDYYDTAQKMKFSVKDFLSKCDNIRSFLRIWSHLLKKSLMEMFIFFAILVLYNFFYYISNMSEKTYYQRNREVILNRAKYYYDTAQKMKFCIKDFFSKCDKIRSFLLIWLHLLKKSLMEIFIFFAILVFYNFFYYI